MPQPIPEQEIVGVVKQQIAAVTAGLDAIRKQTDTLVHSLSKAISGTDEHLTNEIAESDKRLTTAFARDLSNTITEVKQDLTEQLTQMDDRLTTALTSDLPKTINDSKQSLTQHIAESGTGLTANLTGFIGTSSSDLKQHITQEVAASGDALHRKTKWWHASGIVVGLIAALAFGWDTVNRLESIDASVHTKYIGRWPGHFRNVTNLISRASKNDEILILGDFVGNWHYTRPEQYFNDYYLALLKSKVHVSMLVFDSYTAIDRLGRQFVEQNFRPRPKTGFCSNAYFDDTPDDGTTATYLYDHYLEFYQKQGWIQLPKDCPNNYLAFINLVLRIQDHFCSDLSQQKGRIEIRTIANPDNKSLLERYMYYYWVVPDKEMVLSFRRYRSINLGSAFSTVNSDFIREFTDQFEERRNESRRQETDSKKKTLVEGPCYPTPLKLSLDGERHLHLE